MLQSDDELCASCGKWVTELDVDTGWCYTCAGVIPSELRSASKREKFLRTNANTIEALLSAGYTLSYAIRTTRKDNRPICLCCSAPIHGGNPGSKFCSTNKECRAAQRRYRTLREGAANLPAGVALEQVCRELSVK